MNTPLDDNSVEVAVLRKVSRRLIPFIFLLFVLNILDRANVGFARLQMLEELHLSEEVFGFGGSIFFIGYFLFQVPSNLILNRIGARLWIAGIVVAWGLISTSMMFIRDAWSFYVLRFLLGIAESGFFPGMILYLTYWIPARERAQAVASFMTASAIAGMIGGPLSGALMQFLDGTAGLSGWQWMFLMEGLPTVILGFVVFFWLTDRPEVAGWLTDAERDWLSNRMRSEQTQRMQQHGFTLWMTLCHPKVWLLSCLYFVLAMGANGFSLYLPELVRGKFPESGKLQIGLLSAIPYALAVVCMILSSIHSDRTGERRWHVAVPAFLAAVGWGLSGYCNNPWLVLGSLSLAAIGMYSTFAPFWSLPNSFLSGAAAAGGIALINSVGNLGGFAAPMLISKVKAATNSFAGGLFVMALVFCISVCLVLCVRHERAWEKVEPS
ncbi:MAG: Permease of the major facilitator superfamily [Planctomycetaceae bacterium]|nr:Permease of the major facilitator superfamily [Planctomycetaceae bacterium]